MNLTLMSLFDGSGGFPLAGAMHGIVPVYAAEVEPYPIAVTRSRFPNMRHLGSVTEIKGAELEPVDVVTFGSPCQDLSVAGLQKGIHDGARSNLFFQAVRIIKEMRDKDARTGRTNEHIRPRTSVFENVPGLFSSNGGRDFQAVLQALAEVADPDVSIPFPEKGKWTKAGCIVGDGWSIAWRTLDAQFFGLAQRRKRCYLVADFGSERTGEILFEPEGLSGHFEPGTAKGQGTAEDSQGSLGRSDNVQCLNPWDAQTIRQFDANGVYPALMSNTGGGQNRQGIVCSSAFMGGQGAQVGSIAYTENCSPTLRATQAPDVVYAINSNFINPVVCRGFDMTAFGQYGNGEKSSTLKQRDYKDATDLCVETGKPPRKWIVRRPTPTECARLQGFPDMHGHPDHKDNLTDDEYAFWLNVRNTHAMINGRAQKQYTREQMLKWYNGLHTDSAEYKMWGNGIALPCAAFVLGQIARLAGDA